MKKKIREKEDNNGLCGQSQIFTMATQFFF